MLDILVKLLHFYIINSCNIYLEMLKLCEIRRNIHFEDNYSGLETYI